MSARAERTVPARAGLALIWLLALVLGLLTWATVVRLTYGGGAEVDLVGTATVTGCTEHGPVGVYGFGTTHTCAAEVAWSDGRRVRELFPAGQLGPADAGLPVPVYEDRQGRGSSYLGRIGSARWSEVNGPVQVLLGVLVAGLGVRALLALARVFHPEAFRRRGNRAAGAKPDPWPLTTADRAAAGVPAIVRRARLLAGWCLLTVLLVLVATVPRLDAPRARRFASPWPQIEASLLLDPPPFGVVIFGVLGAVLALVMAAIGRSDAARLVRYGPDYLLARSGETGRGSPEKRLTARLDALRATAPARNRISVAAGLVFAGLALWAAIRFAAHVPADAGAAGPLVWLACGTDVLVLGTLAALWLSTVESRHRRLERLLQRHRARTVAAS